MKRVLSGCICQTLQFAPRDEMPQPMFYEAAEAEVEAYKRNMDRKKIKYKIIDEKQSVAGSIVVQVIKEYNGFKIGDYLH